MIGFFLDPSFYLLLGFIALVVAGVVMLRVRVLFFLRRRIDRIARDLNNAACEKDRALLQFTRVNRAVGNLSNDIARVWSEQVVDFTELHEDLEVELRNLEERQNRQLEVVQSRVIQREVYESLNALSAQFALDLQQATSEEQKKLIDGSLSLLEEVTLSI